MKKEKKIEKKHEHKWQYAGDYGPEIRFVCECGKAKYVNET